MIDSKIFTLGATSISIEVSRWKKDGKTPAAYRCRITHESNNPSGIAAERETALQAERDCVESFVNHFTEKPRRAAGQTVRLRQAQSEQQGALPSGPAPKKSVKPKTDDFEY